VTCAAPDQVPVAPLPRLLSFDPASMSFSTFALEAHVVYKREVAAGDPLRFEAQMLDFDGRFFHYIAKMYHDRENWLAIKTLFTAVCDEPPEQQEQPVLRVPPGQQAAQATREQMDLPVPPEPRAV